MLCSFKRFLRARRKVIALIILCVSLFAIASWLLKIDGHIENAKVFINVKNPLNDVFIMNSSENRFTNLLRITDDIRNAMLHSWKAYKLYAWGADEVNVISKTKSFWMHSSLTMIDSLDTLWLFDMKTEFNSAMQWINLNVMFDYDDNHVSVFESTIRILGGLLSAYHLSHEKIFLEKAVLLGKKLLVAFQSKHGLPLSDVNFAQETAHQSPWSKYVSLSEVSSLQLEFNDLAVQSNLSSFAAPAAGVFKRLHDLPKTDGLLPIFLTANGRAFKPNNLITLGARGDSYYEYLLKVWVQTGKQANHLKNDYLAAINGIKKTLLKKSKPNNLWFIGELNNNRFSPKMDHLVCFLPGTLAYGFVHGMPQSHLQLAKQLMRTCFNLYNQTKTGLSPELVYFNLASHKIKDFYTKLSDSHSLLRPETVESLFYLYRITKDPIYRVWGKKIFYAFEEHARLPKAGYASIRNVNSIPVSYKDKMESFWMAETLKYFYLLFNDTVAAQFDFQKYVFNTEAHALPIFDTENQMAVIKGLYA